MLQELDDSLSLSIHSFREMDRAHSIDLLRRRAYDEVEQRLEEQIRQKTAALEKATTEVGLLQSELTDAKAAILEKSECMQRELSRVRREGQEVLDEAIARHERAEEIWRSHTHEQLVAERAQAHSAKLHAKALTEEHERTFTAQRKMLEQAAEREGRVAKRALTIMGERLAMFERTERERRTTLATATTEVRKRQRELDAQRVELDRLTDELSDVVAACEAAAGDSESL